MQKLTFSPKCLIIPKCSLNINCFKYLQTIGIGPTMFFIAELKWPWPQYGLYKSGGGSSWTHHSTSTRVLSKISTKKISLDHYFVSTTGSWWSNWNVFVEPFYNYLISLIPFLVDMEITVSIHVLFYSSSKPFIVYFYCICLVIKILGY